MKDVPRAQKPPAWILVVLGILIPAWPLGIYWLNNSYSGWNQLAAIYPAQDRRQAGSLGPTSVTIIQSSGRRWTFEGHRGHVKYSEVGFDKEGFWVKSRGTGWFSGPGTPIFVPWEAVEGCEHLRLRLGVPRVELLIADQKLLDACRALPGKGAVR